MPALAARPWLTYGAAARTTEIADAAATRGADAQLAELDHLVAENHRIHDRDSLNLNPATNVMNPRAEAMLAARLGSRPSLGYPGEKYEMGLEAIEQIEVIAAELVAEVFRAAYAEIRPRLITLGASLNLTPHPVAAVREIADEVGARVLFDAAHLCGLIAGGAWDNPLDLGAHLMTFSTYKSLGGPAGGVVVTREPDLAERIEAIAYPGLTANFDAAKSAALAVTMVDWQQEGRGYAAAMVGASRRLAQELAGRGAPVFETVEGPTLSHQFALRAHEWGGGQAAAHRLRAANLLACGIGLPVSPVEGDVNGLRIGTPELVRIGLTEDDMPRLASLIVRGLAGEPVAEEVANWRRGFTEVHYIHRS